MALSLDQGSFALNTSTGNQAVTGVGFEPKVILFYLVDATGDGSAASYAFGLGSAISSTERFALCGQGTDARATY